MDNRSQAFELRGLTSLRQPSGEGGVVLEKRERSPLSLDFYYGSIHSRKSKLNSDRKYNPHAERQYCAAVTHTPSMINQQPSNTKATIALHLIPIPKGETNHER
ncbi:hypothetical protein J28TS4_40160 [Paenibacillus lautus]|nr:hypothetical protein J28TS4_40160 [Paenibacillus lautus]